MVWTVTQRTATLEMNGCQWSFNLDQPQFGVSVQPIDGEHWQLLQVHPSPAHACQVDDSFVRGSDLMVRYGQSESDRFAFQLDFRALSQNALGPFAGGLDIWLSVQTQLLDSHPTLEVRNQLLSARLSAIDPSGEPATDDSLAALFYQTDAACVAIMIHPSDRCQTELVSSPDALSSGIRLFGNFMEKGVIRRGRLRCLIGQAAIDQHQLVDAYAKFAASPLPLTT